MKRHFIEALTIIPIALWLVALPAAAQGRSQSQGHAATSSHEPMGMDQTMSTNEPTKNPNNSMASGPKTPGELLGQNHQLSSKLAPLVGCTGAMSSICLQMAAQGFKNLGQFVAAAHVSHNLGIPFTCLRADMTGMSPGTGSTCPTGTGTTRMSLGKSIQTLKPDMTSTQVKSATRTAEQEANSDTSRS